MRACELIQYKASEACSSESCIRRGCTSAFLSSLMSSLIMGDLGCDELYLAVNDDADYAGVLRERTRQFSETHFHSAFGFRLRPIPPRVSVTTIKAN